MWDARIAPSLNKIIQSSFLLQKGQSGGTERLRKQTDSFAEDRSFASTSSESLVSTVLYSILPTNSVFFLRMIVIRIFSRLDGIFLSVEQFPPDDILKSLYKSGNLKTLLELYNLEIHQKKAKRD